MVATLRVVLDQLVVADRARARRGIARARARRSSSGAPSGCEVEAIAPAGGADATPTVPGLSGLRRTALPRRELAAALQLGVGTGIGGGMIHSPSLFAPLVQHDRLHDNDQTVVTVWDLRPWESPNRAAPLGRSAGTRRCSSARSSIADAVVVPTHTIARRLARDRAGLGDRIRVDRGRLALGFAVPDR